VAFVNARDTPSNYNDLGQSQIVSVGGPTSTISDWRVKPWE